MRLAPVPMFYAHQPHLAIEKCADSSRTTHANLKAVDACRYFGAVLVGALNGQPKQVLLLPPQDWEFLDAETKALLANLEPDIAEVAGGSFKRKSPPEIQGGGYVVHALEAALWAFYRSSTFKEGVLMAANLGDDADTTAAIYGQLAGAFYGEQGIPEGWRSRLAMVDLIIGEM